MATDSIKEHMGIRNSSWPMIPISQALRVILGEIESPTQICHACLTECGNRILAKDIKAPIDLPRCNTSIMDGYAMNFALNNDQQSIGSQLGIYKVVDIVTAGNELKSSKSATNTSSSTTKTTKLQKGEVVYVTTGSALPIGTDCVVKIEDTEIIDESTIKILFPPKAPLQSVRTKGSDISKGQLLFKKGEKLRSSELGILASCGITIVPVYSKMRITILSTGDELKDPFTFNMDQETEQESDEKVTAEPTTNLIFDSNKIMLMELIKESLRNLCVVTDGGIMADDRTQLKQHILDLLRNTDILVTTGGVSMGSRDYIKPILSEIGKIHFGRVSIKPGKPTTFATVMVPEEDGNPDSMRKKLVFGLPGNPVSAQVCFKMFVDPAIKKWTGICSDFNTQHPPISVEITKDIRMDPERPNYNRCVVYWDKGKSRFMGYDTGSQRSSRLLSCKSANCLLRIPQKEGVLKRGTMVKALVIGQLTPEMPPKLDPNDNADDGHQHLMGCDCGKSHGADHDHKKSQKAKVKKVFDINIRICVLTVSDRAAKGVYEDKSGPALAEGLTAVFGEECIDGVESKVVPDEQSEIEKCLNEWDGNCHLIVTTGGTGCGPRDYTPESTSKFIERKCPGLVFKMMAYGLQQTDFACLSRYNAGISHKQTLIINMPGKVKAVKECLDAIGGILPHAINQIYSIVDDACT